MTTPTRTAASHAATPSFADPAAVTAAAGDPTPAVLTRPSVGPERYVLGAEIGRGGMGVVYRATDAVLGREVAVKVLLDRYAPTSATAGRFADEARITGQLQHPGIPPVHDLGTLPDGRPFLAMKLIKGDTLDDLLNHLSDPAADRGRFVAAFEQVCQAVACAHSKGVVHRDLKPGNVMVGAFGEVQVMDWGLAKLLSSREGERPEPPVAHPPGSPPPHATRTGSVLGTPAYMPPEQAIGAIGQIDARSDVFGLGAILAVILTGRPPFQSDSAESTRQLAAKGKVQDCYARLDGCGADPELIALGKRCLAPEKEDRPADAGEVAKAVAALRAAADDRARQAELDRVKAELKVNEQRKRRRAAQAAGGLLVAVLAVGAAGTAVGLVQARRERDAAATARADAETAAADARRERDSSDAALSLFGLVLQQASTVGQARAGTANPNPTVAEAFDGADRKLADPTSPLAEQVRGNPRVEAAVRKTMGETYFHLQKFADAERQFTRLVELRRQEGGDTHPDTLSAMNSLALSYQKLKKSAEAEGLYRRVVDEYRRQGLARDRRALVAVGNLGTLYDSTGRPADAEPLLRESLDGRRETLGPDHEETIKSVNNLGMWYYRQNRFTDAEPLIRESLAGFGRTNGEFHPNTVHVAANLALTNRHLKHFAAAEEQFLRVMAARDKLQPSEWERYRVVPRLLIATCEECGRPDKAAEYRERFREFPLREPLPPPRKAK